MRKICNMIGVALCIGLGGCTSMARFLDSPVPTGDLEAAITAATALESSADAYLVYCTPKAQPVGCDNKVIREKLVPDVRILRKERDAAQAWLKANNGKAWVSAGVFNGLENAIQAINGLGIEKVKS